MAKYSLEEITDRNVWEKFILSKEPKSFLQSWDWGQTNNLIGLKIFRLGLKKNGKLIGACLVIKEKARRGTYLEISGGPVIDWKNRPLVRYFVKEIRDLAVREGAWFVRVRPELLDSEENRKFFGKMGFISSPMHLHAENTWVLDISGAEEEILKGMRKTTRYLVRKSDNFGLSVEISKDPKHAKLIHRLQAATIERHNFVGFSQKVFRSEIEAFTGNNNAAVFVCKYKGRVLAAAIIIFYGDTAYYHYSGSLSGYPKIPFSYYLQWQIIKEAKLRGLRYYNFWGIAPNDNPKHRFAGVTIFKTGFGGERIDWLHAHDLPVSPLYWLTYAFENVRKLARHL